MDAGAAGGAMRLVQLDHPLVACWLSELRDVPTPPPRFRALLRHLSAALFLEATRDLSLVGRPVRTPLADFEGRQLARPPLLVPVLRAGLGMVEAVLELVPEARVAHLGLYRDHETLAPVTYYTPRVTDPEGATAFLLDPMLATGGSAVNAIGVARQWGVAQTRLLSVIAAPEGVQRVREAWPDTDAYLCGLDERLNEFGFILPGLGDAGDRQFG